MIYLYYNVIEGDIELYDSSLNLFNSLINSKYSITNLVFIGDSVSAQLFNFLFCDLYQINKLQTNGIQWVHKSCQFCLSYADFWLKSSSSTSDNSKLLRIYNRQFNLPCLHDSNSQCDNSKQSEFLSSQFIQRLLDNITRVSANLNGLHSSSSQTIFILNYGLHILSPSIADWSLRGMLKGFVHFIQISKSNKKNNNNNDLKFFYRETSSQVFSLSRGNSL